MAATMSANGRKRPFKIAEFGLNERPLSGKADVQNVTDDNSCRVAALPPEADIPVILR